MLKTRLLLLLVASFGTLTAQTSSPQWNTPKPGVKEVQVPLASLKPSATFKVGGTADWVLLTEDAVWITTIKPYSLRLIDPATNKVIASVRLSGEACSGLEFGFGSIWAPVCGKKPTLVRVDAHTNKISAVLPIAPAGREGGITASGDSIWMVTDKKGTLTRIDPSTNSARQRITIPLGSYNPLFSDGIVWITRVESNVLVPVDASTGGVLASIPVGSTPRFLTAGGGSVWTLNQGGGSVSRVDTSTKKVTATIKAGIPGLGGDICYGTDSVWATVFDVPLTQIDAKSNDVLRQWVGKGGDSVRVGFGSIWLTDYYRGLLWRIVVHAPEASNAKPSTSEKQQVSKQGTQNPEAYELYLKGRSYWAKRTRADLETAVSYFNQAIAKDPGYAVVYAGLADCYAMLPDYGASEEDIPKAKAAALKALELDPTLSRPHVNLGGMKMAHDWDFAGGEAEFKKALELDPNDSHAHQRYADNLCLLGGREQESLAEINRAHQLDPLSLAISVDVGRVYTFVRRFDEAIVACKKVANESPTFADAHSCLALAYWGKKMYPQAIEESKAYGKLTGERSDSDYAAALEQGFRSGGRKGALSKSIETLKDQRKTGYSVTYDIAEAYADLGDKEQAFQWLNTAFQEHDIDLMRLRTDFMFDSLRSDPRFAELVSKVGLPQ
jgi:virginiamycin B lyase